MKPLRSLLFAPGTQWRIEDIETTTADLVILDLQDLVADDAKVEARDAVHALLDAWPGEQTVAVRINPPQTATGHADLHRFIDTDTYPDYIMVPEVDSATVVQSVARLLEREGGPPLIPLIESPAGVFNIFEILTVTAGISGVAFGSVDFQLQAGMPILHDAPPLTVPRFLLSMAAGHAGVPAFDAVTLQTADESAVRGAATEARSLGFDGKLVVNERQVEIVNDVFTPSSAELAFARRVVDAFDDSPGESVTVDGWFVDKPLVETQRELLDRYG